MSIPRKTAPRRIGIFMPRWLGDFVMATPAVRAIRKHFGDRAEIIGIMRPYLKEVLAGTSWFDQQWYFDSRRKSADAGHFAILRKIRAAHFDTMILMPNSPRSALLSWLGNAKERIGYVRHGRGPLLTGKVYLPKIDGRVVDLPMVDYYLRLADTVGCPEESPRLELTTTAADERSADVIFRTLGIRRDGRLVTFNCSGAYGGAKLWPVEHFAALARKITRQLDHDVLVMCGPNERVISQDIARQADCPRVFSMADQALDIGTAKACIRRGRLMVSTDSGPRHLAAALGQAVITLYGPMLPVWGRNPTVDAIDLLQQDLSCLGCHKRVCPFGHHRCMRDLSVDRVFGEVAAWMDRNSTTDNVLSPNLVKLPANVVYNHPPAIGTVAPT